MDIRKHLERVLANPNHGPESPLAAALLAQIALEEVWPSDTAESPKGPGDHGSPAPLPRDAS
ncbi:MAG: hypothetical protein ACYCZX_16765 [Rhodospirillaceae bacterium]